MIYSFSPLFIRKILLPLLLCNLLILYSSDRLAVLNYRISQHFTKKIDDMKAMYYTTSGRVLYFMDNTVTPFAASIYVKVMETLEYIHSHPMLEKIWDWLLSLDIEKHYQNFKYYVVDVIVKYNEILDRIDSFWEKLNNIPGMSFFVRAVQGYIKAVSSTQRTLICQLFLCNYVLKITNAWFFQIRWVYDVTELDRLVQALMTELRVQGWQALVNWWHSNCRHIQPHVTRYDPEHGEYEVQMKMPVSFSRVSGVPDWPIFKHWDRVKKIVSKKWALFNRLNFSFANGWAFWDLFYAYKPSSNPLDWIPPFKCKIT